MAESVEELMFRIRLAEDELNQQFVQVSQTVKQNLERINRERNLIDLQANIELAGLDRATDATEIFEVQQRRLQRQIELQQSRLQVLSAVLRDTAQRTGENSEETQRAQVRYEQARLSVARYERQLRELNAAQEESGVSSSKMLDAINKVGAALRNWGEIKEVIAAMAASVVALTEKFKELEKVAYDFNLPFDKAREFADKVKLAGGELEDIGGFLRGLTDAIVKGEVDDPEWITLEKYDAQILDATGRLKDYAEIMEELHKAFLKAKAAGEEVEFLQMLGGESGVTDAMQIMERWGDATADASKVVKAALDPAELQQSERAINLLTLQLGELMDALSNFLSPTTAQTAETLFDIANSITAWLVDNKDLIKETGWELARLFGAVPDIPFELANKALLDTSQSADKLRNSLAKLNKEGEGKGKDKNPLSQYGIQRTHQFRDEIEDIRLEIDYLDEYQRKLAQLDLWRDREINDKIHTSDDERGAIEELYSLKYEQIFQEALEKSKKNTEQLVAETNAILNDKDLSPYEREIQKIQEWKDQAEQAVDSAIAAFGRKNEFLEESAAITAAALAKEAEAFEREIDRIKGKTQSLAEKIFEQQHSQRDIDIMRAQKQWHEYTQEGVYPQEMIDEWLQGEYQAIARRVQDAGRSYRQAPRRVSTSSLPNTNFYGEVQDRVNDAMSQVGSPGYELFQQHAEYYNEIARLTEGIASATNEMAGHILDLSRNETRTINLTVSPTIELGGAYVFDNRMKAQLTEDITNEIADAVRDAIDSAVGSQSYSYGS
ncbi:MAG: hypothetical protein IJU91_02375 [Selenomonadaceae bacterium]|nr:hypothetical protein [Selenomonadaceae bacterium]